MMDDPEYFLVNLHETPIENHHEIISYHDQEIQYNIPQMSSLLNSQIFIYSYLPLQEQEEQQQIIQNTARNFLANNALCICISIFLLLLSILAFILYLRL